MHRPLIDQKPQQGRVGLAPICHDLCRYETEDLRPSFVKIHLSCTGNDAVDSVRVDRGRGCDKGSIIRSQGSLGRSR
jgi:hypothetical protein